MNHYEISVRLTYAFVAKLNPDGSDLVFSTYLNGDSSASGSDLALAFQKTISASLL